MQTKDRSQMYFAGFTMLLLCGVFLLYHNVNMDEFRDLAHMILGLAGYILVKRQVDKRRRNSSNNDGGNDGGSK